MDTYTPCLHYFTQSAPTTSPAGHFGGRNTLPTLSEPSQYTAERPQSFVNPAYSYVPNTRPRSGLIARTSLGFSQRYSTSHPQAPPSWLPQMNDGIPFTSIGQTPPHNFQQSAHVYDTEHQTGPEYDMDAIFGGISTIPTTGIPSHLSRHPLSQPIVSSSMQTRAPIAIPLEQTPPLPTLPGHDSNIWSGASLHSMMASYRQHRDVSPHDETSHGHRMFSQEPRQGGAAEVFQPAHIASPSYTGAESAPTPTLSTDEPNSEQYISSNGTPTVNTVALEDNAFESFLRRSFPGDQESQETLREAMTMIDTPAGKAAIIRLLRVNTDQGSKTWSCTFGGIGGMCPDGVFKRRDAATAHILQKHLYVYPVKCDGECGDRQCKQRFPGSAAKSSHTRKAQKRVCDLCHQLVGSRNYSRHRKTGKCHNNAALV